MSESGDLKRTPLFDLHLEHSGRMVDFAGWSLPVRFDPGPVAEHVHTREAASLFDVSHMGIVDLHGPSVDAVASALEALAPADVVGLAEGRQRYTFFTNDQGGVIDDFMVGRIDDVITLVVNASRREVDLELLDAALAPSGIEVVRRDDLALLAIQGPSAATALAALSTDSTSIRPPDLGTDSTSIRRPDLGADSTSIRRSDSGPGSLAYMGCGQFDVAGVECRVSRSGYTGEDGFELQIPAEAAVGVARALLDQPGVELAGLAARDSLRLEAGLCLYGNDLDESTTPVEAGLAWAIPARRRAEGGFPGADVIQSQLAAGPGRMRVGLRVEGRRPVRAGAELHAIGGDEPVGIVTSGGVGATFGGPIAMGYLAPDFAAVGTQLLADERGRPLEVSVTSLPFVPPRNRLAKPTR